MRTNDKSGEAGPEAERKPPFLDRRDAGRQLAPLLEPLRSAEPLVLALPRGGVPVGYEVALYLDAPLYAFPARKIGSPYQPELGVGAVAPGGTLVLNEEMIRELAIPALEIARIVALQNYELEASLVRYWRRPLDVTARTVILVDDGLATGSTASAGLLSLRKMGAAQIVLAVPVCAAQTVEAMSTLADTVKCVVRTGNLSAVGHWYANFDQISEQEVDQLLNTDPDSTVAPIS